MWQILEWARLSVEANVGNQQVISGERRLINVFLCHNSKDKSEIKLIADALELDFGIPHFLDAYAIPTGEAFIPWIERKLNESTGCAIFLGSNGWGPTHLWEAEMALARARKNPEFLLIPVALDGVAQADMERLGSGTLFRDINWADFRKGLGDPDALEKFRIALTGEELQSDRGPTRLTPYQIRRDAARWAKSKGTDTSVLYRGQQLAHAERLAQEHSDILAVGDVIAFLTKSAEGQRTFWRKLAVTGFTATVLILMVAIAAVLQYFTAEARRVESLSRQLALLARDADGADRQLLVSVQAYRQAPTNEAFRTLYDQLTKWQNLELVSNVGQPVETLSTYNGSIFAGLEDGSVLQIKLTTGEIIGRLADPNHHGRVTATFVDKVVGDIWIGREDGSIDILRNAKNLAQAKMTQIRTPTLVKLGLDPRILSFAGLSSSNLIVAGTATGDVVAIDSKNGKERWHVFDDPMTRITSLASDENEKRIFYGTQYGVMTELEGASGNRGESIPGFEGGVMLISPQNNDNSILVLAASGLMKRLTPSPNGYRFNESIQMPGLLTAAAMITSKGWLAIGDGNGNLHIRESVGGERLFGTVTPHRSVVRAVATADPDTLVSASDDGMIAVWSLAETYAPATVLPQPPIDPSVLRVNARGILVAAGTKNGMAGVWSLEGGSWRQTLDLIADSIILGGDEIVAAPPDPKPEDGFLAIGDSEITGIAINPAATAIAWTTQAGGILWHSLLDHDSSQQLLGQLPDQSSTLTISTDGSRVAAVLRDKVFVYERDVENKFKSKEFTGRSNIRALTFRKDNKYLALGLEDGRVEILESKTGDEILLSGPITRGPAGEITYDTSSTHLLVNGVTAADRRVILVDPVKPREAIALQVRQAGGGITAQSLTVDGKTLATGDLDGQLILWDLEALSYVANLRAGGSNISAMTFDDANGRLIAASSTVGLLGWPFLPKQLLELVCEKIGPGIESSFDLRDTLNGQEARLGCQKKK
jgi:WD40 repeat protein